MSFFEQQWDPTVRENLPSQVNAWRNGQVNTASTPGYTENARKAQNSASGATIVDGKIIRPVHARPRESLPSNVHGFHNTDRVRQSVKQTGRLPTSASGTLPAGRPSSSAMSKIPPSDVPGQPTDTVAYAGSSGRFSGPESIPKAQSSSKHDTESRASSPSVACQPSTKISDQRATKEQEKPSTTEHVSHISQSEARETLPPHLRNLAATKTDVNTSVKIQQSKSSGKMDAGKASRSIKYESNFPCTYEKCTRGFMNKKALKDHKEEEHDYCRVCDEDYEDEDQLLDHKMKSENHICCGVCGQDFRSEAGRDKHVRQFHPTPQEVVCPGCQLIFETGNGLVAHIYGNQCKTRDGDVSSRINELKIRESRAAAAVFMDKVSHRPSNTSALIAAMQPPETRDGQSTAHSVDGGVPVKRHLMDDDNHDDGPKELPSALIEGPETARDESYTRTAAGPAASAGVVDTDWPTIGQSMQKGKGKEVNVIEGLSASKGGPSNSLQLKDSAHAKALIKPEKPMPKIGQWPEPSMPDYRRNMIPSESGSQHIIRTDWDPFEFVRNFNGEYDCPFVACKSTYLELNDLKWHLTSGYHQGTDPRCMKCFKVFKTIAGVVAHMERSEKCKIRETLGFGNVLHVTSGGFLGVSGRHADGSIKIEVPDVADDERYMLRYEDDDDEDEMARFKPGLLLPPPHQQGESPAN